MTPAEIADILRAERKHADPRRAEDGFDRPCVCGHAYLDHAIYADHEHDVWIGRTCRLCEPTCCERFRPQM